MKVRKGQSQIELNISPHELISVCWFGNANHFVLAQIQLEEWDNIVKKKRLPINPSFFTVYSNTIKFHPPVPYAGEIKVAFTTYHEV